jgi:hypothetical protein
VAWAALATGCGASLETLQDLDPWLRHTIDDTGTGADGARPGDVNNDGLMDLVAAWEGSGEVKVYLNPGPGRSRLAWPAVRVASVPAVEDAMFGDLDGDGGLDVISSAEGDTRAIFVHWAPRDLNRVLDPAEWSTAALPAARGAAQWMFCLPLQLDQLHGPDLVCGSKEAGAAVGWFRAPPDARDLAAWTWQALADAGWIMSLAAADADGDGDPDLLVSDRQGPRRGIWLFENLAGGELAPGRRLNEGTTNVMFLDQADINADGLMDIVAATSGRELIVLRQAPRQPADLPRWDETRILLPPSLGTGKAVRVADLDADGRQDIVVSCEGAAGRVGLALLSYISAPTDPLWTVRPISGSAGDKYDLIQLLDLDADGDLDVVTTEENTGLGVVWYENPRLK